MAQNSLPSTSSSFNHVSSPMSGLIPGLSTLHTTSNSPLFSRDPQTDDIVVNGVQNSEVSKLAVQNILHNPEIKKHLEVLAPLAKQFASTKPTAEEDLLPAEAWPLLERRASIRKDIKKKLSDRDILNMKITETEKIIEQKMIVIKTYEKTKNDLMDQVKALHTEDEKISKELSALISQTPNAMSHEDDPQTSNMMSNSDDPSDISTSQTAKGWTPQEPVASLKRPEGSAKKSCPSQPGIHDAEGIEVLTHKLTCQKCATTYVMYARLTRCPKCKFLQEIQHRGSPPLTVTNTTEGEPKTCEVSIHQAAKNFTPQEPVASLKRSAEMPQGPTKKSCQSQPTIQDAESEMKTLEVKEKNPTTSNVKSPTFKHSRLARTEQSSHRPRPSNLPVIDLNFFCVQKEYQIPVYDLVHESGPPNKKRFVMRVLVNGIWYQPTVMSVTKKKATHLAATVCLQALGLRSKDSTPQEPVASLKRSVEMPEGPAKKSCPSQRTINDAEVIEIQLKKRTCHKCTSIYVMYSRLTRCPKCNYLPEIRPHGSPPLTVHRSTEREPKTSEVSTSQAAKDSTPQEPVASLKRSVEMPEGSTKKSFPYHPTVNDIESEFNTKKQSSSTTHQPVAGFHTSWCPLCGSGGRYGFARTPDSTREHLRGRAENPNLVRCPKLRGKRRNLYVPPGSGVEVLYRHIICRDDPWDKPQTDELLRPNWWCDPEYKSKWPKNAYVKNTKKITSR